MYLVNTNYSNEVCTQTQKMFKSISTALIIMSVNIVVLLLLIHSSIWVQFCELSTYLGSPEFNFIGFSLTFICCMFY